ncbi:hypothetical protein DUNSADRAFT_16171 [Dunaliella salina]|uniref:Exonuclease domain-containing protein n=1 Tax=Dunaliella salina TaxID=3046 RepID=A0ABQ7G454_DUNSA|nr:hypothetical protein DUNSADRAFT_16171 [Dunaliella salina]|eukprot:KAF5829386.1 hypothetical protein DUNSADRAFT_16171 [Dunaliella salina]
MHTSFEKHNGLMTPLSRRQLSVAYRIAQALWKHVPMTYGFPSQAGLSTTSEATRSRAAADLSKPVKPKGRPRKNLTSVEPSGSSSSSTQPTSVLHYLPPSKKGERDPLREVIAITPRLQPAALDAPAQVDAVPASIHTHTKAETPAATASAQSAVISAAPWEMWTKDAAPSPALHTQQGNKVSGRNNSKTSNKSSNSSSSSSSSASISGVHSLPSQTSPDSKPSSQGLSSSTSSSTSSSSCSSMPSAPAGHRESHPQPAMLRSNDPLFGGGVATNIGLWELPGMAPGSTPASMQELLHAIQPLPSPQVGILIARMHVPIYKQTNAQTHRVFVCDQENTAHFGFSWDTNCKARVVDVCVIDVATGDRFNTLVDPQAWIDRRAVKIHGISHKTVRGAPRGPHVWLALLLWIYQRCEQTPGGAPALFVAHNAHTDTKAIGVELARAGLLLPNNWAELCSLAMSKELLPDEGNEKHGRRLQDLASLLQVDCSCLQLHRAEVDCDLLIQVVDAMLERRFGKGNHLLQSVALSEDERLSRGVAIKPLSQTKRLYNILSAVRKWNPKQWAVVYSRYAAATRAAGMNPINDEQSSENSSSNKVTKQQVQKAKHVQESEKQQRSGRSRRTGGPDVIGAALPGLVGGVGGHTEAPAVATAGKGKQGGSKGSSLSARQQQQQLEQAPVDLLRAPDFALFDRSKEGSVGLEVQRQQQQQKQLVLQEVEQALREELEADAARLDKLKDLAGQAEQRQPKQQEQQPQQQHMHELLLPESASAHSLSVADPQAITEGHTSDGADGGVVWSTEGLGEQQQQQQQQQDEGVVWSTQGLGEQQWQQQLQQEYEMAGSDRWREADPLADIESAFDEQALSDLSPPSAEPTAFPREGTDQIEAQRDEGSTAIMTDATTATPTIDTTATAVLEQHMAPKERQAAPTKPAKVPPVWSYLREPPYKERMATKKWFTAAQLKKLEQSDLSNLISVLAHYPRAYKAFTPSVQPHLPEQCVEVEATVLESKVTNMRGRGQAVLSMLVQAPLAHPQYPSLHSGSSSSSSSSSTSTSASSGRVGSNNNMGGSDLNSGSGGGEQAGLPTTVISVTKFAAGGVWAGRQLEDLQRKLGSRFVLKTSLEAVYPGEEADCLKWFSKKSLSLHPRPQWRTTGVPDILPGSLQHAQPDHHNKMMQGPGYALEPVYPACTPLKPEDFYSSKPSKAGKDIIGRALGGLGDLSSGVCW